VPKKTRLEVEEQFLRELFPAFTIQDPYGPRRGVIGQMHTNSGKRYALWLALGDFPNEAPQMYIVAPERLVAHNGQLLATQGGSAMHLLQPDAHGHPQICHYNGQFWHPKVTLSKILMKGRLWLEAYEQHLHDGRAIEAFLPHMH
jgi:hypothetical protein